MTTELTKRRFKILALFAMHLGIWEDKMEQLADAIDRNHPKALEALKFYEESLIAVMEADKPEDVVLPKH